MNQTLGPGGLLNRAQSAALLELLDGGQGPGVELLGDCRVAAGRLGIGQIEGDIDMIRVEGERLLEALDGTIVVAKQEAGEAEIGQVAAVRVVAKQLEQVQVELLGPLRLTVEQLDLRQPGQ